MAKSSAPQPPPARADIKDADEWWGSLGDAKRVQYHRWLTGKGKLPPPEQPEVLFGVDGMLDPEATP